MGRKQAWDGFSLYSAGQEVTYIYGKMTGRDRKLSRRTGRGEGEQKQCVREGE